MGGEPLVFAPKLRAVLALLLISRGRTVPISQFVEEIWLDRPPTAVSATMQTYIYQLRKLLGAEGETGAASLVTDSAGYALKGCAGDVDVHVFESFFEEGKAALKAGDHEQAIECFSRALAVWRSTAALADVPKGACLEAFAVRLEEARMQAIELRIEACLRLGRELDVLPELRALAVNHPLHEGLHGQLMLALHRAGRRHEALEAYRALREELSRELGLEPCAALQRLHRSLLAGDLEPVRTAGGVVAAPSVVPAQLPPEITEFCGRKAELAQLEQLLTATGGPGPRIAALSGMAGGGKTALVVHAAHRVRRRYPDGQFFACFQGNLGVRSGRPPDPYSVIGSFLRGIGFLPHQIPDDLAGRSQLFRSWCADRSVLIVLDDVCSEEQVWPLLPAGPHCAVLVTSRAPLYALGGGRGIEVGTLPAADAVELLSRVSGCAWDSHDRPMARLIADRCEHLPLAVRAVGSLLAQPSRLSLRRAVDRLTDRRQRLQLLRSGNADLCGRLEHAYGRLDPLARRVLRSMADVPAEGFTAGAVARLLGLAECEAEAALERLYDARFVVARADQGGAATQYGLMELVRLFVDQQQDEEGLRAELVDCVAGSAVFTTP
ncbi:BTAD domain-containing putative transcriptional regulator [Kitasatospora sp. NPDC096140]|uniref:AfsR/SARP family transcriptional regulator n=1 Tax=Kitasatospora sp. NPDC096140 TaxID=3155425 RepID=UPI00332BA708